MSFITGVWVSRPIGNSVDISLQADDWLTATIPFNLMSTDTYQPHENVTSDDNKTTDKYPIVLFTVLIFKWILSPFLFIENVLTITVVVRYIRKVTPTHVVITFHSISGLFVAIIQPFNVVPFFRGDSLNSKHLCGFLTWVNFVAFGLNICAVLLIAIERCFLVTSFQLHRKFLTARRQVYLCVGISVCHLLSATIYTMMVESDLRYGDCCLLSVSPQTRGVVYFVSMAPYVVVSCSIAYCYLRICRFVWKQGRALASNQNSSIQNSFQKEKRTTVTIVIILTVYVAGTAPAFIYSLLTLQYAKFWKTELYEFFQLLWNVAAITDSFIYARKIPEFKEGYRKILCCLRKSHRIQVIPLRKVESPRNNLPLEPSRDLGSFGSTTNHPTACIASGTRTTETTSLLDPIPEQNEFFSEESSKKTKWNVRSC